MAEMVRARMGVYVHRVFHCFFLVKGEKIIGNIQIVDYCWHGREIFVQVAAFWKQLFRERQKTVRFAGSGLNENNR